MGGGDKGNDESVQIYDFQMLAGMQASLNKMSIIPLSMVQLRYFFVTCELFLHFYTRCRSLHATILELFVL